MNERIKQINKEEDNGGGHMMIICDFNIYKDS